MGSLLIVAASAAGFLIAGYLTLTFYHVVPASARFVPAFCRIREDVCLRVLEHPDARLLGVPNSLVGIVYYMVTILYAAGVLPAQAGRAVMVASWLSVVAAVYLGASLMLKIRIGCPLCMTAHALNLALAVMITVSEGFH